MEATQCAFRVYGYDGSSKVKIGESQKDKRVCRFCGRSMPDVKFKKVAHALSESIGNKHIINNEECDSCNENFSIIEQDFFNRHAAILSICNIKGKNGARKVKTETVDIYDQHGILTLAPHNMSVSSIKYDSEGVGSLDFSLNMKYHPHKPQNVYKCLVKYALSVMESDDVAYFGKAITWIAGNNISINRLPKVIYFDTKFHQHPRCSVFLRNEHNTKFPFAFSIVEFANIGYCFIIPFGNDESITGFMEHNLIGAFLYLSNGAQFSLIDLSTNTKITNRQVFTLGNLKKDDAIILPNPVTPEIVRKLKDEGKI